MWFPFLFFGLVWGAPSVRCDYALLNSMVPKLEEGVFSYVAQHSGLRLEVGGKAESLAGPFDREALKRKLTSCTPAVLACLDPKVLPSSIEVSFDLAFKKKTSVTSGFEVSAAPALKPEQRQCIIDAWSTLSFAAPGRDYEKVRVRIPIRIAKAP